MTLYNHHLTKKQISNVKYVCEMTSSIWSSHFFFFYKITGKWCMTLILTSQCLVFEKLHHSTSSWRTRDSNILSDIWCSFKNVKLFFRFHEIIFFENTLYYIFTSFLDKKISLVVLFTHTTLWRRYRASEELLSAVWTADRRPARS